MTRATVTVPLACESCLVDAERYPNLSAHILEGCTHLDNTHLSPAVADCYGYASRLAESLARRFPDLSPDWKPLPDLMGVLTQIDNAAAGLVHSTTPAEANDAARYRWLRYNFAAPNGENGWKWNPMSLKEPYALAPFDATVDAAMAADKERT